MAEIHVSWSIQVPTKPNPSKGLKRNADGLMGAL